MTRIDIISVQQLFDQHLIAEYREILMIPSALKRTLNSKKGLDQSKICSNDSDELGMTSSKLRS